MKQLIEDAKRMIRINSVTQDGNEELSGFVGALLQDRGLKTQLQQVTHSLENVSKRQFNVVGILGDPLVDRKTRKGLLLLSHLDTCNPGIRENWTETAGDPYAASVKEGKIFGLGTADAKLDFLCKLKAVEKFRERKLKMPVYLVGTCGEEIGMFGARYLIKSMALNPKYVLVGAPTELRLGYSHKGLNLFRVSIGHQMVERDARGFNRRVDLHAKGRSAHSSHPGVGVNAILEAIDLIQEAVDSGFELRFTRIEGGDASNKVPDRAFAEFYMTSHQFEDFKRFFRDKASRKGGDKTFQVELGGLGDTGVRFLPDPIFPCLSEIVGAFRRIASEFEKQADPSFDPPFSTVNFGMLKPRLGGIDLLFDIRLLPEMPPEATEKRVMEEIAAISAKFPSLNLSCGRDRSNPVLKMSPDHEFVKLCQDALGDAGVKPVLERRSPSSEAAQYFHAGYEAVMFGPGIARANSHSPNEYNSLDQMEKAIGFYEKLIERVCL